ncbi:ABC transporter permease [Mucilaginibacter sp. HMF5004]|uniref:MlaE family ABC transporter permease n=1 Tax=Mucilaginibacter rivuli TaxID=2857527 RepID=UPI001C5D8B49|nr:ABC transporter permease [Mucilaginibacter rivuli]MBW4890653.1 ABC transporter permease [Mucilaginibacter rivuli]
MDKNTTAIEPAPKQDPAIKRWLVSVFIDFYKVFQFVARFFREVFFPPYEFKEVMKQCYEVGVRSLTIISVTAFIIGVIFTKQSRPSLSEFGATSWLPRLVSIAIMRALAPLITAIICAGKVGSSIGAELGSMRVTEQIDAMEVSGTKPFKYLVVTRVLATSITVPILATYAGLIALIGGYVNVAQNEGTSYTTFMEQVFEPLNFVDFTSSLAKSIVFGFTIGVVGCYQGYNSTKGTEGVGKAANMAVVTAMFLVFIEEVIIVQIFGWFR